MKRVGIYIRSMSNSNPNSSSIIRHINRSFDISIYNECGYDIIPFEL